MKYTHFTPNVLELHPIGNIEQMLVTIAKVSYDSAVPRGLGFDALHISMK